MSRSEEDLKSLLKDVKVWFTEDMKLPYKLEYLSDVLEEEKKTRFRKFVFRRLNHLPDDDLIKFIEICRQDALPPPIAPIVPQPKIEVQRGKSTKR